MSRTGRGDGIPTRPRPRRPPGRRSPATRSDYFRSHSEHCFLRHPRAHVTHCRCIGHEESRRGFTHWVTVRCPMVDAIAVHGLLMDGNSKIAYAFLCQATPLERRTMGHLQPRSQESVSTRRVKLHDRGCNFPVGSASAWSRRSQLLAQPEVVRQFNGSSASDPATRAGLRPVAPAGGANPAVRLGQGARSGSKSWPRAPRCFTSTARSW